MDGQAKQEKPTSTATSTSGSNHAGGDSTGKDGRGNKHAGSENKKGSDGGKIKRIAACDVCRLRKVKCVKEEGETRCQGCIDLNRECTQTYSHKRPGPPNPYARPSYNNNDGRYNPYPMPAGSHPHARPPYPDRSPHGPGGSNNNNLPYLPYDPNYTDALNGNIPLPPLGGGYQFDVHQQQNQQNQSNIPGHTFNQMSDPNIPFAPHQPHHSPTASISPFSSTHQNQNIQLNPNLSNANNRPPSHNAPPSMGSGNNQNQNQNPTPGQAGSNYLTGYSAEDNWFMPWICSTPGADGQPPMDTNMNVPVASGSGGGGSDYPLTGPGTGSTHSSSVVLPDIPGRGWSEMGQTLEDEILDPRLGGSRRTGTYQTSRMRSRPNSPPNLGGGAGSGFEHSTGVGGGYAGHAQMVKRGSATTSLGGTVGETPIYQAAQVEDITRWSTALTFLNLYHEHLYPLLPIIHWPTYSQDLVSRRDRHDETFRIFLMSLIAYAILQLPRSVMPDFLTQEELVKLHRRLHHTSRAMQKREYEPLDLLHISTLYLDHIYLGSTGKDNYANVVLAEAMRLAITLGLHDENVAVQQNLDAIEKETRRRVFWVLYGSDRTIAALISCPMLLHDEDIFVSDILQVDDNLITTAGAFQQPPGKTPLLCGFIHVTRIFRLLSQVLRLVRSRAHGQPTPEGHVDTSPDPRELIKSLQNLLDDLPPPLRLNAETVDPRDVANNYAFDTCKANILVTQVLVRFAIYQYATLRAQGRPDQCLDELTEDVLKRLHQMSSESLAANGESIRHKVLFIASSLLNKYPAQDSAGHEHVADFLQVYNKILTNQTKSQLDETEPE